RSTSGSRAAPRPTRMAVRTSRSRSTTDPLLRRCSALAVLLAAALLSWPASAAPRIADPPPAGALAAALRSSGVAAGRTGALVLDLDDGTTVFGRNADKPLAPASTEKLTVTLAALQELG